MPLWKRPDGKGWRYQFQYEGKRYSQGGFATKAEARAAMEKHRAELKLMNPYAPEPEQLDFLTLATEYLEFAQRRFAVKTFQYKKIVYRNFLEKVGNINLEKINIIVVDSYLKSRETNVSYNRHRKDLGALFAWAVKRNYMSINPCLLLDKLPEPEFKRTIPTHEEMAAIVLAAGEHRAFILTIYYTLARVDEIMRLKWEDVNFSDRTIRLWTRKRKDGNWQNDILPMSEGLYEVLKPIWDKSKSVSDYVFVNPETGDRYYDRRRIIKSICKRAGVRPFMYHAIRHYVASTLADREKASMITVSRLLRHKSIRTTEIYLQKVDDTLRETMGKIDLRLINGGKNEAVNEREK